MTDPITAPMGKFCREIALIGESTGWEWAKQGLIETVAIGHRRLVVVESYRRLIAQRLREPQGDARRNAAVPALGTKFPPEAPTLKRGPGRPRKIPLIAPSA
jgi:hypothetical protein